MGWHYQGAVLKGVTGLEEDMRCWAHSIWEFRVDLDEMDINKPDLIVGFPVSSDSES